MSVFLGSLMLAQLVVAQSNQVNIDREILAAKTIELEVGQSRLIEMSAAVGRVSVANPQVADVRVITPHEIQIVGIGIGETHLSVWDKADNVTVALLKITRNLATLRQQIKDLFPGERIDVSSAGDLVILSGEVSDLRLPARALEIAALHSAKVANLIKITGNQQVQLEVRFAEVSRSGLRELGSSFYHAKSLTDDQGERATGFSNANNFPTFQKGKGAGIPDTGQLIKDKLPPLIPAPPFSDAFNVYLSNLQNGMGFSVILSALEENGMAKTLAEPNLVALSGTPASFHAGGLVPVPTGGSLGTVKVSFKPFGIQLEFHPTVLDESTVQLKLGTEVSEIDPSISVSLPNGFAIPGFAVRRSDTTIRLRDGQSFAIAGLLSDRMRSVIKRFPLLGDIPVLGALFRSTSYSREETELLVVVTVHMVQPLQPHQLPPMPGESEVNDPDMFELFMLGRMTHEWGEDDEEDPSRESAAAKTGPAGEIGFYK